MDRKRTFWTVFAYLLGLLILGVLFAFSLLSFVPDAFISVPVGVPWFGAVGAVLISLTGVFAHEHDWDPNYWPWHVARPFVGASLGVVGVLIFLIPSDFVVHSFRPPMEAAMSRLWSQLG